MRSLAMTAVLSFTLLAIVANPVFAALQQSATASGPASAGEGQTVTVTGTSPSGESGSSFDIGTDTGSITDYTVTWIGNDYTLKFVMPDYNEGPAAENIVDVSVTPSSPHTPATTSITVNHIGHGM